MTATLLILVGAGLVAAAIAIGQLLRRRTQSWHPTITHGRVTVLKAPRNRRQHPANDRPYDQDADR